METEGNHPVGSTTIEAPRAPKWVVESMERIAEILILAEPDEAARLDRAARDLHKIATWLDTHDSPETAAGACAAVAMLDAVVASEAAFPEAALDVVRRALETLQAILCDGRDRRRLCFPDELGCVDAGVGAPLNEEVRSEVPEDESEDLRDDERVRRPTTLHAEIDDAIFADFLSSQGEVVAELEELVLELEKTADGSVLKALRGLIHTLKGDSSVLGLTDVERVCHACEDLLDREAFDDQTGLLLEAKDWVEATFAYYRGERTTLPDPRRLLAVMSSVGGDHSEAGSTASVQRSTPPAEAPDFQDGAAGSHRSGRGQTHRTIGVRETVKIDAERLDRLLDTIGELVIAESMVCQSEDFNPSSAPELERRRMQLDKITRTLQVMSTSLRMVPVRPVFLKMARLVRDLAIKAGKEVEFVMSGENTELDKAVVDRIGDPLLHVLRNAVDHGIEEAAVRQAAGKPATGRIELRAFHRGGSIFIEVEDDGRGLDRKAIVEKATLEGLFAADAEPMVEEIFGCVFAPGFSTAQRVTDVSGRGVGLDVVKRAVDELRGQINLRSSPGEGCLISIRLPLSLAIIDGMVVRAGAERYIVPTLSVLRFVRPSVNDLSTVVGRGEMLSVEGTQLPLYRLDRLLDIEHARQDPCEALAVVVEDNGRKAAVLVDALVGQQQIVIKGMGDLVHGVRGVAGGAIMPDGQVGLIADVAGLVELAHSEGGRGEGAGPQPAIDPELPNGPDPGLRGLTGKTAEVQS